MEWAVRTEYNEICEKFLFHTLTGHIDRLTAIIITRIISSTTKVGYTRKEISAQIEAG